MKAKLLRKVRSKARLHNYIIRNEVGIGSWCVIKDDDNEYSETRFHMFSDARRACRRAIHNTKLIKRRYHGKMTLAQVYGTMRGQVVEMLARYTHNLCSLMNVDATDPDFIQSIQLVNHLEELYKQSEEE